MEGEEIEELILPPPPPQPHIPDDLPIKISALNAIITISNGNPENQRKLISIGAMHEIRCIMTDYSENAEIHELCLRAISAIYSKKIDT